MLKNDDKNQCSFSPAINHYKNSNIKRNQSGSKVEDRLLMLGEKYKEKKEKMRIEELQRRKEEEDFVLQAGQAFCKGEPEKGENNMKVEDRLLSYQQKYAYKQQERVRENEEEIFEQIREPNINEISKKIVSNKPVF